jgi:hypothetical protein
MAKIHIKTLHDPDSYVPWKEFFGGSCKGDLGSWIPDDFDLVMGQYDPESATGAVSAGGVTRVATSGSQTWRYSQSDPARSGPIRPSPVPAMIRTPVTFRVPKRSATQGDPVAERLQAARQAARDSFTRQVADARAHTANILSKLGNAK